MKQQEQKIAVVAICRYDNIDFVSAVFKYEKTFVLYSVFRIRFKICSLFQKMTDKVIVYGGRGGLGVVIVDAFKVSNKTLSYSLTSRSALRIT